MTTAEPGPDLGAGPLLAFFAHPDDETLQAGGLLALAAAAGRRVVLVTATRGERGEMIGRPDLEGTDAVAQVRAQERAAALAALGVTEHHWLDELVAADDRAAIGPQGRWIDSGMVWTAPGIAGPAPDAAPHAFARGDVEIPARALARLVRQVRPALVLTDEVGGSYGHPDHVRAHAVALRALALAAAPGAPAGGEDAVAPVHAVVAVAHDRQRAANDAVAVQVAQVQPIGADGALLLPPPAAGAALPSIVRPSADVDVELDVTSVTPACSPRCAATPRRCRARRSRCSTPVAGEETATHDLAPSQAAIGWYALSNGVAAPLLPVVGLTAVRGDVGALLTAVAGLQGAADGAPAVAASSAATPVSRDLFTRPTPGRVAAVIACLLLGVLVGVAATVVHRWRVGDVPLGMVLAVATVLVGALAARSWTRGPGLAGFAVGTIGVIQAMAFVVTGGDVLVPGDTLGTVWLLVSVLAIGVAAFLPERFVGARRG
ncbi:PIG-L family deacetylase [Litorihabitans aurantiacus]|uniref:N-acetyl-1-D-myo-inositol-2-amino-2-deoxy-alpha-D-glucopyranoside deacetylase n=1 Tax=Litorihabitans aurantiacus TaxID=1930061 RepID=A0AA37UHF2_9MICO|nr:PIG-L family deacetylase [Litorihabitans aurantiacus]GMA30579.1 hypothetical protein GCM10025875_05710 [Litorihabitans aurantiacus]